MQRAIVRAAWAGTLMWLTPAALAGQAVEYVVEFPNLAHHEAEITVTFTGLPPRPLEVRMSRSSPGRYALHEFAKNVYDVRVVDGSGAAVTVRRPDPYQWDVPEHDGVVQITYVLFADRADGTYSQIDRTHAHLNAPATFMWARGLEARPATVTLVPPADASWRVATQLVPTDDPWRFTAPHRDYLLDSPIELSDFSLREWSVGARNGDSVRFRVAVHHDATEADVDRYTAMAQRVVAEQVAVFGDPPPVDYGTYTFIADYLPHASGDGMEHRNSTILTSRRPLTQADRLVGTVSHELFHAWNVERIRPRSLEPFNFERANMSDALWFAEGFTSYYGALTLRRAGLRSMADYASGLANGLNAVLHAPGRRWFSPAEMSALAPFVDAATAVDPTNWTNTFISYYTWGAVLGLQLDLTLRAMYGRSLDDFMRLVWTRFGAPELPYAIDDLEATLADYVDDPPFAEAFFRLFVHGHEVPDYRELLAPAGMLLRPRNPGGAWLGWAGLTVEDGEARLTSPTEMGSPWYEAGLDQGDRLLRVADRPIPDDSTLTAVLHGLQPGDTTSVVFVSRGETRTTHLVPTVDPRLEVVLYEDAGRPVTPAIEAFRRAWLGSRVP